MLLKLFDTSSYYKMHPEDVHYRHHKDMIVLHETVSPDYPGLKDIKEVENYLANKGYGIHGMTDAEGNIAWARGFGNAVFYHAGGVNERAIGIEQVADTPHDSPFSYHSYWEKRTQELRATSKLVAAICRTWNIPLRFSNGDSPGITSHWNVSQIYRESQGHWDCHPRHLGGYYPIIWVINQAKFLYQARYSL